MVGKLLLTSNGVTILPLLVKKLATFNPLPVFPCRVPLQLLVADILSVRKSLLVTTKCNYLGSRTVIPLHLLYRLKNEIKVLKRNF